MPPPQWPGYGLLYEDTSEDTLASTGDIKAASNLEIPDAVPIIIEFEGRAASGSANEVEFGLKLNSTTVSTAAWNCGPGATDEAASGFVRIYIGPREANYLRALTGHYSFSGASGLRQGANLNAGADMPTGGLTSIAITVGVNTGSRTAAVKNLRIYAGSGG